MHRTFGFIPLCLLTLLLPLHAHAKSDEVNVDVSGSFRVRYESLNNPIFPAQREQRSQSNQRLSTRLVLATQVSYKISAPHLR